MLNHLLTILQTHLSLDNDKPIIVGVSGGPDSMTLLYALVNLDYPVVIAHFNHKLRPEADDEAQIIKEIAVEFGAPFTTGTGEVYEYAQKNRLSLEGAARQMRYHFLFENAISYNGQAVAVGHNLDDQVETILMHLLRGAGLQGLTGMSVHALPNPWSTTIPLLRPLLGITREEIEAYCAQEGFTIITDPSNMDTSFFRNRLRHELIPQLEKYVPGIKGRLWKTADLLSADNQVLDELTDSVWEDIVDHIADDCVFIEQKPFSSQSLAIQRRIIRKVISHLRLGGVDIDFGIVSRALGFVSDPARSSQADLGLGVRIAIEGKHIIISDWQAQIPTSNWPQIRDQIRLPIPGEILLYDNWMMKAEIPSNAENAQYNAEENRNQYQALLNLPGQKSALLIRNRLPGDKFKPLGMLGKSMKISDFMINQKIPRRARDGWPLVCYQDEIIWVPGYRLDHRFRLTDEINFLVKLSLKQQDNKS